MQVEFKDFSRKLFILFYFSEFMNQVQGEEERGSREWGKQGAGEMREARGSRERRKQ
jgi:hypothetical protein